MNKQQLLTLINNPKAASQGDLDELQELVDQYPYFQIGHALIAKIKADNKAIDYKRKIHLAAITTADRNVLKALINDRIFIEGTGPGAENSPVAESPAISPEPEIPEAPAKTGQADSLTDETASGTDDKASAEKDTKEVVEEKAVTEVPEEKTAKETIEEKAEQKTGDTVESPEDTKAKEDETVLLGDLSIKKSSDTDKAKVNIADDVKDTNDPKDNLYKELEENLRSLQRRKAQPTPKTPETPAEKTPAAEKKTTTTAKTPANKKATPSKTPVKKPAARTGTTSAARRTATTKKTPVKPASGTVKKTTASPKADTKKAATKTTAKTKAPSEKKAGASKKKLQKNVNKDDDKESKKKGKDLGRSRNKNNQTEIIEEFIKKEPSISKPALVKGQEQAPQKDLSLKSIEIKEDLVSENLAIIMEKQGKIQKAKDIYKKLIWKFPQKKAYFASRIEELESL